MAKNQPLESEPLVFSVAETSRMLKISKALTYQLIREGRIRAVRISKRRLVVPVKSLQEQLETQHIR